MNRKADKYLLARYARAFKKSGDFYPHILPKSNSVYFTTLKGTSFLACRHIKKSVRKAVKRTYPSLGEEYPRVNPRLKCISASFSTSVRGRFKSHAFDEHTRVRKEPVEKRMKVRTTSRNWRLGNSLCGLESGLQPLRCLGYEAYCC